MKTLSSKTIASKTIPIKTIQISSMTGFTLIELIIVLAIAGILFSSAIPSFSQMLAHNKQEAQLYTLFHHHQLARSEAIKTNSRVILCKSSDAKQCSSQSKWADGWIIFSDTDNNKIISNNEHVIFIQGALSGNLSLKYKGFGSHNSVRYFPDGHSSTNGTFTLCSQFGDEYAKSIIISRTGRARIASKSASGKALTCA